MKRMIKYLAVCLGFLLSVNIAAGQDSTRVQKFHLKGYQKFMTVGINPGNLDQFTGEQLLHNRLEARWDITKHIQLNAGLRTRLFYGELVKTIPDFGNYISRDANDYWDLDALIIDRKGMVLHTVLDRLYAVYSKGEWELELGRQRINWGIATLWNPNDLFNAYNFTDFDYEERPGSDAVRLTWYKNWNTSFEIAGKLADRFDESVLAARAKFGIKGYDIQLTTGNYYNTYTVGGGFAGNLFDGSLKGEMSYFTAYDSTGGDSYSATLEYQRSTTYNLIYTFGGLYNSGGQDKSILNLITYEPTAANLYPYKYSAFIQGAYTIGSLTTCGLAVVYSFNSRHPLFISPTFTYSAAQNLDIDLVSQISVEKAGEDKPFKSPYQAYYLRFKYSF